MLGKNQKIRIVQLNNKKISYLLTRKNVKNINLRIKKNCDVVVSANNKVSLNYIDSFVLSKIDYIISSIEKFNKINQSTIAEKQYIDGEYFLILGEKICLKLIQNSTEHIVKDNNYICLYVKNVNDIKHNELMFKNYLNELCKTIFDEISNEIYPLFYKYNIIKPQIKIRKMTSRWGSCQTCKKIITLNTLLIKYPRICIEYVILHEFCHLVHPNHSKDFYNLVSFFMPDWKYKKSLLENPDFI